MAWLSIFALPNDYRRKNDETSEELQMNGLGAAQAEEGLASRKRSYQEEQLCEKRRLAQT